MNVPTVQSLAQNSPIASKVQLQVMPGHRLMWKYKWIIYKIDSNVPYTPVWSLKRTRLPQNPFSLIQRLNWWHSVRHWYDYKIVIRTLRRYMWYVISSPPNAAYMRQWIMLPLVQIMACRLFGAKPLSKPMLSCCQLHPWEQTSVKF